MEQSFTIKIEELKPALVEGMKKYFSAVNAKEITISFDIPKKSPMFVVFGLRTTRNPVS